MNVTCCGLIRVMFTPGRLIFGMFTFDPYSREVDNDPYPLYRRLRDNHPCFWSEGGNCWVLSRYQDIVDAAVDWQTFSSAKGNMLDDKDIPERAGVTLGTTDPPRHDQMRRLLQFAFMRRNFTQLEDRIRALVDETIDGFIDGETFDFITAFSSPVTVGALSFLLGLPRDDFRVLRGNIVQLLQTDPETRSKTPAALAAFDWLKAYTGELLEERKKQPTEDLLSILLAAEIGGDRLSEREIHMIAFTLVMAGVESASSFMAMLAYNLAQFGDVRRAVVRDPARVVDAVDESLRFNTSAQRFCRTLTRDHRLHGQALRAGDKVMLCYGSGNRDERKFPDPDRYDLDRRPRQHLGTGTGKHQCIAAQFARQLIDLAMRELHCRVPDYRLADPDGLEWISSVTFRSPVSLELAFTRH